MAKTKVSDNNQNKPNNLLRLGQAFFTGFLLFIAVIEGVLYVTNLSSVISQDYSSIYFVILLSSCIGTFVSGMISGLPILASTNIGLAQFSIVTLCGNFGFSYENTLALSLVASGIVILLILFRLHSYIFEAIPKDVVKGVVAGVGLIVAIKGVELGTGGDFQSLHFFGFSDYSSLISFLIFLAVFFLIIVLKKLNFKFATILPFVGGFVAYFVIQFFLFHNNIFNVGSQFSISDGLNGFKDNLIFSVFTRGFDFENAASAIGKFRLIILAIGIVVTFVLTIIYYSDISAYVVAEEYGMVGRKNDYNGRKGLLFAGAINSIISITLGAPIVTVSENSIISKNENGEGRLSVFFATLFLLAAVFFYPLIGVIPKFLIGDMLLYAGLSVFIKVGGISWKNLEEGIPSLLVIVLMCVTRNVLIGLSAGFISYIVIKLITAKGKEINMATWVMGVLFALVLIVCM